MFDIAHGNKPPGTNDLVPYWMFEVPQGATIRRRTIALPLSRDQMRYRRLQHDLAIYRLAFAQPRQDDLLACFHDAVAENFAAQVGDWMLNLQPV